MTFHLHFANDFSFSLQSSSLTFHILSFLFPFILAKSQKLLFIAIVLNPRYKMQYVNFILSKTYGSLLGKLKADNVEGAIIILRLKLLQMTLEVTLT